MSPSRQEMPMEPRFTRHRGSPTRRRVSRSSALRSSRIWPALWVTPRSSIAGCSGSKAFPIDGGCSRFCGGTKKVLRSGPLATPAAGLRAVVLEGEAGIGKTRMLDATADMASERERPFWVLDVSADEELRGPFLLFRSLLTSPHTSSVAKQAMALEQLTRAQEAIAGRTPRVEGFSPQEQMLRTFDEVATTVLALTRERPLVLMFDDLQWADDDSIQLIRYLVRTVASGPIFLLISLRPYSDSSSGGASKLIADLDRMRVTQVLSLH